MLVVDTDASQCGIIEGTVCDQLRTPLPCTVTLCMTGGMTEIARDVPGDDTQYDRERQFMFTSLHPQTEYDLCVYTSGTNVVVRNVRPNGPPLAVIIPAYRITANIVARNGEAAKADVSVRGGPVWRSRDQRVCDAHRT